MNTHQDTRERSALEASRYDIKNVEKIKRQGEEFETKNSSFKKATRQRG